VSLAITTDRYTVCNKL